MRCSSGSTPESPESLDQRRHPALQYNTCYWALVKSGRSPQEAQAELKVSARLGDRQPFSGRAASPSTGASVCTLQGTLTQDKNELLFSRFGINYSTLPARFRKACWHSSWWLPCCHAA